MFTGGVPSLRKGERLPRAGKGVRDVAQFRVSESCFLCGVSICGTCPGQTGHAGRRRPIQPQKWFVPCGVKFCWTTGQAEREARGSCMEYQEPGKGLKAAETGKGLVSRRHKPCISKWCRGTELNCPHGDFQSPALPTELPRREKSNYVNSASLASLFLQKNDFFLLFPLTGHQTSLFTVRE